MDIISQDIWKEHGNMASSATRQLEVVPSAK